MSKRNLITMALVTAISLLASEGFGIAAGHTTPGLEAFLTYCMPALTAHDDVVSLARINHLKEILHTSKETEFMLPDGQETLVASGRSVCSVLIHTIDPKKFLADVDYWMGGGHSPLKKLHESTAGGIAQSKYAGRVGGTRVIVLAGVRQHASRAVPQAILTGSRE